MDEYKVKIWVCEVIQEWMDEATAASPNGQLSVTEAMQLGLDRVKNKVRTSDGG